MEQGEKRRERGGGGMKRREEQTLDTNLQSKLQSCTDNSVCHYRCAEVGMV